jgi:hypothetical protein
VPGAGRDEPDRTMAVFLIWTLALSDGRRSCIHLHKAGLFALEEDAIHRSCGHSGAVEADCEARVPG